MSSVARSGVSFEPRGRAVKQQPTGSRTTTSKARSAHNAPAVPDLKFSTRSRGTKQRPEGRPRSSAPPVRRGLTLWTCDSADKRGPRRGGACKPSVTRDEAPGNEPSRGSGARCLGVLHDRADRDGGRDGEADGLLHHDAAEELESRRDDAQVVVTAELATHEKIEARVRRASCLGDVARVGLGGRSATLRTARPAVRAWSRTPRASG